MEWHEEAGHSHSESADIRCAAVTLCAFCFYDTWVKRVSFYMFESAHMLQQKDNVDLSLSLAVILCLSHS